MDKQTARLMQAMIRYDAGDPARIQHFIKVHDIATTIGILEGVDDATQRVLEAAAILHDIGIHMSEEKYSSSAGIYQEIEGPPEAGRLLADLGGYTEDEIDRIKYLIGHHHTYVDVQGVDYQILIEADFLVNLYEDSAEEGAILIAKEKIFKTSAGIQMLDAMF